MSYTKIILDTAFQTDAICSADNSDIKIENQTNVMASLFGLARNIGQRCEGKKRGFEISRFGLWNLKFVIVSC